MNARSTATLALALLALAAPASSPAQGRPDPAVLLSAQREAMAKLSKTDGEWRGTAWNLSPGGEKHVLVQAERAGPFPGGAVREGGGRIAPGKDPVRFFELELGRLGDSDWPAAGDVPRK